MTCIANAHIWWETRSCSKTTVSRPATPNCRVVMYTHFTQENPTDTIIPAYPMLFGDSGTTDLADSEGAVGIMFNGVSMYR